MEMFYLTSVFYSLLCPKYPHLTSLNEYYVRCITHFMYLSLQSVSTRTLEGVCIVHNQLFFIFLLILDDCLFCCFV
jgi:hypothetical protein